MRRPDPSVRFRAARQDEADALTEIVMSAKASWGYALDQLEAWRPSLAVTRSQIQRQPVFVAEVARRTVGFYSLRVTADGCELDNCWIVPGQMRPVVPSLSAAYLRRFRDCRRAAARRCGCLCETGEVDSWRCACARKTSAGFARPGTTKPMPLH